jgi:hypothetical protein
MGAQLPRHAAPQKTEQLCEMSRSGNSAIALFRLMFFCAASSWMAPVPRLFDRSHTLLRLVTLERDNAAVLPAVPILEVDRN